MEKFEKTVFGDSVLYHGNFYEILPELEVTADAVITDSPFRITACEWDDKIDLPRFWELANAKTKPAANFIMFGCGKFSIDLVNSNYSGYRYDLIWAKNNRVGFYNANLQPLRAHEQILVFGKNGNMVASTYNPLKTPGGRPRVNRANGGAAESIRREKHPRQYRTALRIQFRYLRLTTTGGTVSRGFTVPRNP